MPPQRFLEVAFDQRTSATSVERPSCFGCGKDCGGPGVPDLLPVAWALLSPCHSLGFLSFPLCSILFPLAVMDSCCHVKSRLGMVAMSSRESEILQFGRKLVKEKT